MNWIFLVDSSHTIFHHSTPRIVISEMTGALPCVEELFAMAFEERGPAFAQAWKRSFSKLSSVDRGVSLLMGNEWTDEIVAEFGRVGYQDMFILIASTLTPSPRPFSPLRID
jgi:hypothetical protein